MEDECQVVLDDFSLLIVNYDFVKLNRDMVKISQKISGIMDNEDKTLSSIWLVKNDFNVIFSQKIVCCCDGKNKEHAMSNKSMRREKNTDMMVPIFLLKNFINIRMESTIHRESDIVTVLLLIRCCFAKK